MIQPKNSDIGRKVVYRAHASAEPEEGVISSLGTNPSACFVRYGAEQTAKSTPVARLEWMAGGSDEKKQ